MHMWRITRTLVHRFGTWLREGNIFENGTDNIEIVKEQRWSTRLFLILFIAMGVTFVVLGGLERHTSSVIINNPSHESFLLLQQKYPDTFKCPCSQVSIEYEKFLSVWSIFHQICSSSFITQEWIEIMHERNNQTIWPIDARKVLSTYSQFLKFACEASREGQETAVNLQLSLSLVTPDAMSPVILKEKIDQVVNAIWSEASTLSAFLFFVINEGITDNLIISGLGTNAMAFVTDTSSRTIKFIPNQYELPDRTSCLCSSINQCSMPAALYSQPVSLAFTVHKFNDNNTVIPGMKIACYPIEGILISTLECYFNSSCLELLVTNATRFKPLDPRTLIRFSTKTTVQDLFTNLMIENLIVNYSYITYYKQCSPKICSYSTMRSNTMTYFVTTIISLFGGYNSLLRIIAPLIMQYIFEIKRKLFNRNTITPIVPYTVSAQSSQPQGTPNKLEVLVRFIVTKIAQFNLFDSDSDQQSIQYRERVMTKIYAFTTFLVLIILLFYTSINEISNTYIVHNITQAKFEYLNEKYPNKVWCPCKTYSMRYDSFMSVNVRFHQVCSSELISDAFLHQFSMYNNTFYHPFDFVPMTVSYFSSLTTVCKIFTTHVWYQTAAFRGNLFTTGNLLSSADLYVEANRMINKYKKDTFNIADIMHSNMFDAQQVMQPLSVSGPFYRLDLSHNNALRVIATDFNDCSCLLDSSICSVDAGIYMIDDTNTTFTLLNNVNGIKIGCLPILSLLHSNLECWYSNSCYQQVVNAWQRTFGRLSVLPRLLDPNVQSQYNLSTIVSKMAQQAMLEKLDVNISYSSFVVSCDPSYCTYTTNERRSLIVISMSILAVFGGLNVVMQILFTVVIRIVNYTCHHRRDNTNLFLRIASMNLFFKRWRSTAATLKKEQRASRIYILMLVACFSILIIYNLLEKETVIITIATPTQSTYEELSHDFGSTLRCPCSQISFIYDKFVETSVRFHQICTSSFIERDWIMNTFFRVNGSYNIDHAFGNLALVHFVALQSFCRVALKTFNNMISNIMNTNLVTSEVVSQSSLRAQVQHGFDSELNFTIALFSIQSNIGTGLMQSNQLLNVYSLNWLFSDENYSNRSYLQIPAHAISHGANCSCATSPTCAESLVIDGQQIPGLIISCSQFQTFLQSSFMCLYNQSCIQLFNPSHHLNVPALDTTIPSRFAIASRNEELLRSMFIEQWSFNLSYANYYRTCQPLSCSYFVNQRIHFIQLIAFLLGLYGGLRSILRGLASILIGKSNPIIDQSPT